jgi:hypothetical protein
MLWVLLPRSGQILTERIACEREELAFMAVADVARCCVPSASAAATSLMELTGRHVSPGILSMPA